MVGNRLVTPDDFEKCEKYGKFPSKSMLHLHANGLFWGCFIINILLLMIVSILWTNSCARQKKFSLAEHMSHWHPSIDEHNVDVLRAKRRSSERKLLAVSGMLSVAMIPVVIVEAFAALNLNFCHKEDLIMFYWGPFWLLSVGTLIATWGLFLSQKIENAPAWNVALGTPVLVFAGVGHWIVDNIKTGFKKWKHRRMHGVKLQKPIYIPPRYLPHCEHCQQDSYFPALPRFSAYSSHASSQLHPNQAGTLPERRPRIVLDDPEKSNSKEMQTTAVTETQRSSASNNVSSKRTSGERPLIRLKRSNSV